MDDGMIDVLSIGLAVQAAVNTPGTAAERALAAAARAETAAAAAETHNSGISVSVTTLTITPPNA